MRFSLGNRYAIPAGIAATVLAASTIFTGCSTTSTPPPATQSTTPAAQMTPTQASTTSPSQNTAGKTLTIYGAGTLAVPFKKVISAYEQAHPNITIQDQYGGSVKMAKQITQLHQPADILAVADYNVIPKQLYSVNGSAADADWYIGFVSNAITFVYTDKSKGADNITADNWYKVLAEPGIEIGRSNPDTDPSGYQTLQMLKLASQYYNDPTLYDDILKNAPETNIRDTETNLIGALESGQIDYLAIYLSDALQHNFKYLKLPAQINLSDASYASDYAKVSVHTANGDLKAGPIIYAVTIPKDAPNPQAAAKFVNFLLSSQGQAIMQQSGFTVINPAIASGMSNVPAELQSSVEAWPGAK